VTRRSAFAELNAADETISIAAINIDFLNMVVS
jgi:hypothetical protein